MWYKTRWIKQESTSPYWCIKKSIKKGKLFLARDHHRIHVEGMLETRKVNVKQLSSGGWIRLELSMMLRLAGEYLRNRIWVQYENGSPENIYQLQRQKWWFSERKGRYECEQVTKMNPSSAGHVVVLGVLMWRRPRFCALPAENAWLEETGLGVRVTL